MINLLPNKLAQSIVRERLLRLSVAILIALSISGFLGAAMLLPSYVLSTSRASAAAERDTITKNALSMREASNPEAAVEEARAKLHILAATKQPVPVNERILETLAYRRPTISLTRFSYTLSEATGKETLLVAGTATSRDELVAFVRALETAPSVAAVSFPFADLAQSADIEFSLTLSFKATEL